MITKKFMWKRNPNVDGYIEEYGDLVPLEVSAYELFRKTLPSTASAGREQAALRYLKDHSEVYSPILVWQPLSDEEQDPANDLIFLDGRHTLHALVTNFDDTIITILVPRLEYLQIVSLLSKSFE